MSFFIVLPRNIEKGGLLDNEMFKDKPVLPSLNNIALLSKEAVILPVYKLDPSAFLNGDWEAVNIVDALVKMKHLVVDAVAPESESAENYLQYVKGGRDISHQAKDIAALIEGFWQ